MGRGEGNTWTTKVGMNKLRKDRTHAHEKVNSKTVTYLKRHFRL